MKILTRHAWLKSALLSVTCALVLSNSPGAIADTSNAELAIKPINVPSGTLLALSDIWSVNIIFPQRLVVGKQAAAISGAMTASSAINSALRGSGLLAATTKDGDFILSESPRQRAAPKAMRQYSDDDTAHALITEVILVTGTKRDLSIQDTRESVALFTAEQLSEQVLFNLSDVTLRAANVTTSRNRSVTIRGINATGVGTSGAGLTTNIYVDGAPTTSTTFGLNLWDVGQVEILRGPQSTTQGRNALAGAVVIQTADPEYTYSANAQILIGNNDNRQYSATVNAPLIDEQLAIRLVADYREIDFGVGFDSTGEPASFEETLTLRGKVLFEPEAIPGLRSELNIQYVDTEGTAVNFLQSPVPFSDPDFPAFDPFGNTTFDNFNGTNTVETLRILFENQYQLSEHWSLLALGTYEETDTFLDRQAGFSDRPAQTYSAEIRGIFEYEQLSGWLGGYYFNEDVTRDSVRAPQRPSDFGIETVPADATISSATFNSMDVENYAFFFDMSYRLTERWSLEFGARYDVEEVFDTGEQGTVTDSPEDCVVPAFGNLACDLLLPSSSEPPFSTTYEAFLPRAGVTYRFDDLRTLSFGVQRGYRAGGAFTLPGGEIRSFEPEFMTNYELAFRSQWFDKRLTLNGNVFYADWTDQQIQLPDPLSLAPLVTTNAGGSELYGIELDLLYSLSSNVELFGSLGLLETEFTDFPFAVVESPDNSLVPLAQDGGFANLAGNQFPNAASVSSVLGINYENHHGVFANVTVSYTGDRFSDAENLPTNEVDSFVVTNFRIGYRFDQFEIAAFANNLFNEEYLVESSLRQVRTAGEAVPTGRELIQDNPAAIFRIGDARQAGVTIAARF